MAIKRTNLGGGIGGRAEDSTVLASAVVPRIVPLPRAASGGATVTIVAGRAYFVGFTAAAAVPLTTLFGVSRAQGAVGTTLARLGLFAIDTSGAATLVARTASDTTLYAGTFTTYARTFDTTGGYPATYTLAEGQRYAIAVLIVGATTAPNAYGTTSHATIFGWAPFLCASIAGQTDLATSYTSVQLAGEGNAPFLAAY